MNTLQRIATAAAVMLLSLSANADIDKSLSIGITIPPQSEPISEKALKLVETRLSAVLANNGVSSDLCGDFVMCPRLMVTSCEVAEGGMKNLYRINLGMTLFITQMSTRSSYGSLEKELKGTGFSRDEAIFDALKKININDPAYGILINSSKQKIEDYYRSNLPNILNQAKTMSQGEQYDEALNLLFTFPPNIEGSDKAMTLAQEIYLAKVDQEAGSYLLEAQTQAGNGNYNDALAALSNINPQSSHYTKAQELANQIANKISEREENARAQEMLEAARAHKREMTSIQAARDAAVEWAKAQKHDYYLNVTYLW